MKKRILATLMSLCLIVGLLPTAAFAAEDPPAEPTEVVEQTEPSGEISGGDETEGTPPTEGGNPESGQTDLDNTTTEPGNDPDTLPNDGDISGPADDNGEDTNEPQNTDDIDDVVVPTAEEGTEENPWNISAEGDGNNVTAYLTKNTDGETYTLTLSGSGAMADYETAGTPWYDKRESITEIVLPDGLTRIGKSAFLQTAITKVTIPDTVTSIGQNAFWNCNTIETKIPASVTDLGETAFFGTFQVTVAEDNPSYSAVGKIIYDKNQTKLIQVSQDITGTLSIPGTVEEIGAYAFYGCNKVTRALVIPDSVRVIGNAAFYGTDITSLKLGANVQTIGDSAFFNCTSLAGELTIPDSVQTIGASAFTQQTGNNQISAIKLGSGVKSVGEFAFNNCSSVTSLTMNEGLESIGKNAFSGLSALSGDLNIPSTVTTIGDGAFRGCTSLNGTLTIGGALNSIDAGFFSAGDVAADGFATVVLRDGVESIGENAFASWTTLTSVTIPDSVTAIGDSAFTNCSALAKVSFGSGLKTIGDSAFTYTALSGKLELPAGLEEIGANAFSNCTSITEVNIPDTVTKIGYAAFSYNTKTQKVTIPYGNIEYGTDSSGNAYVFSTYGTDSALKTVVLGSTPENVNADILFANSMSNIKYLVLGSGVSGITDWTLSTTRTTLIGGLYPSTLTFNSASTQLDDKATKFTLTDKRQLTYNGTLQMMTFDRPEDGEDVSSKIAYSSSNPEIASVDSTGKITAKSVSDTPVTISASYEGCVFAELKLTVTPIVLTYSNKDGQPNPGGITYAVSEEHQKISDLIIFKTQGEPSKEVTLTDGKDIDYTYIVPTASGGSDIEATVDFLPMPQGKYQVKFNLVNPNYTFAKTGGGTTNTLTIEVNVTATGLQRAYIAAVKPTETTFTYDNTGKLPAAGMLTAYREDSTSSETVDIGDFTIHIEGLNDTTFSSTASGIKAGTNLSDITGLTLPTKPGTYVITVNAVNDNYYIYKSQVFSIQKATVTIKADNQYVYVGDAMPEFTYTVTGLVGNDELTKEPTLTCDASDTNTTGTYTITASGAEADTELYTLTHETGTLTVSRRSSGGGGSTSYAISTPSDVDNGTIKVSPTRASKGSTVTITVTPDEGYVLDELVVTDKNGDTVKLTDKGDGKYTFKMPASKVEIEVSFVPQADPDIGLPFVDVPSGSWYEDAVWYVYENGLMAGTSDTTFAPDITTSRGMIVTILYRLEGTPAISGASGFTDVADGQYYTDAVAWAAANNIVGGYGNGLFGPDDTITREQMAAILYRYAQYKGYDVTASADLSGYSDAAQVSSYALAALQWANAEGLVNGTSDTTLTPGGSATRAQVAVILMRFCENIVK